MSPGKKPKFSPASTAGLDNIIFFTLSSNKKVTAMATAKNVFPVPAGPNAITIL